MLNGLALQLRLNLLYQLRMPIDLIQHLIDLHH